MKRKRLDIIGLLFLLAIIFLACAHGCAGRQAPIISDPISSAGSNSVQAAAHIDAAQSLTDQARPHADDTGKELLDGVSREHGTALAKLADTQHDLLTATIENQTLHETIKTVTQQRDDAWGQIGYRVWAVIVWCWRWFWVLTVVGGIVHVVCLILGLMFTGAAGTVFGTVGRLVNPWAWALWVVEHIRVKQALMTPVPNEG